MMIYYDNKLSTTFKELTSGESPILPKGTLKSWLSRGEVLYVRRARGRGVKALIDVDTLPSEVRAQLIERYGLPEQPRPDYVGMPEVVRDVRALDYYNRYRYPDSSGSEQTLPGDLILEYALNAAILNTLQREEKRLRMLGNKLNNRRSDIWSILLGVSEALRKEYGHTLPASERRLREKMRAYQKEGYASLISKKLGNSNSEKITEEAGEYIVALKLSMLPVLSHEEILQAYNYKCLETGWEPLKSVQVLRNYLYSPGVKPKWWGGTVGELSAYQAYGYKHKTTLPTKRDSLWYMDGTKLNLYWYDGEKLRTTMVIEVIDAATECLLGYCITEREDFWAQRRAVCMALMTAGQRPYELVHDNQGGQTSRMARDLFGRVALVHRTTQPNRPQSKTIESLFGRFQSSELRHCPWYTGANITAKNPESRARLEWIDANRNLLPRSPEELEEQYVAMRDRWNRQPHHETGIPRMEMYLSSVNDALTPLTETDYEELFLVTRPRTIRMEGRGLVMQVDGVDYAYDAYDYEGDRPVVDFEWRIKNIGQDFVVRYNPDDLTKVYLYTEDAKNGLRFERILRPKVEVERAIQDQSSEDARYIRYIQQADKAARLRLVAEQRAITDTWQVGKSSLAPDPRGTTAEERRTLDQEVERRKRAKLERNRTKGIPTTPTPDPLGHGEQPAVQPIAAGQVLRQSEPALGIGQPLGVAKSYKQESLQTWDEVEVTVIREGKGKPLPAPGSDYRFSPGTKEELRARTRRKY